MGLWLSFAGLVALAITVDLVGRRGSAVERPGSAAAWTAGWVALALAFGGFVAWHRGATAAADYFAAFLVEKTLSVDSVFVFALVFAALALGSAQRRLVLTIGVVTALGLRSLMLLAGAELVARFHFILPLCGLLLVVVGAGMLRAFGRGGEPPALPSWLARWLSGANAAAAPRRRTVLAVALIVGADVVFAIDSVPAVLAISTDPFVAITSNVFALLGLRSLYEVLEAALSKLRYVKVGLAVVLSFVGTKLLLGDFVKIPSTTSLTIIVGALAVAFVASVRSPTARRDQRPVPGRGAASAA